MTTVDDQSAPEKRSDTGITIVLIVIWIAGLAYVSTRELEIPRSMLVIGTIFFVVLIPSMKDLVRAIEKKLSTTGTTDTD